MIYFDENKNAYAFEIPDFIAKVENEIWDKYAGTDKWKIINGRFEDITNTPEYIEKTLSAAKGNKKEEAVQGAYNFLASGNAVYKVEEDKSIEATDGNIGKLAAYALGFVTGTFKPDDTIEWTTKEDVKINLTQEQLSQVLQGLGEVQAYVWNVRFPNYITQIEEAQTLEQVNAIEINYTNVIPV